jgi:hypothetical protein
MISAFALLPLLLLCLSERFPIRSTRPLISIDSIEVFAELQFRPKSIAIDPETSQLIFTRHPASALSENPPALCLVCIFDKAELQEADDVALPFRPFGNQSLFKAPQRVKVSPTKKLVYVLDQNKLFKFALSTGSLLDVLKTRDVLHDIELSQDEQFAFLAGEATGIFCVNLTNGREVGDSIPPLHESVKFKPMPARFGKAPFTSQPTIADSGVSLALKGEVLYFGTTFDRFMWMVPARKLLFGSDAHDFVDIAFPKPASGGLVVEHKSGLLFVADVENSAIWQTWPERHGLARTLITSEAFLRWPCGLCVDATHLYVAVPALNELMVKSPRNRPPYRILRVPLAIIVVPNASNDEL